MIEYNKRMLQIGSYTPLKPPTPESPKGQYLYQGKRFLSKEECESLLEDLNIVEIYVTQVELFFSLLAEINLLNVEIRGFSYNFYEGLDSLKLRISRKKERYIERKFMNVLTLFKSFIDQIEAFLKRGGKIKKNSSDRWTKITNKAFDEEYSYRFMTKLRNYVQHVGMAPIMWVNSSIKTSDYKLKMYFSKEHLLVHKSCLGAKVFKDLSVMENYIDPIKIFEDFKKCILEMLRHFVSIIEVEVREAAERITGCRIGFGKNASVGIFWVSDDIENKVVTTTLYKGINDSSSVLVLEGFPYSKGSKLHPDLDSIIASDGIYNLSELS